MKINYQIISIIVCIITVIVSANVMVFVLSDKYNRLTDKIIKSEKKTRDSLFREINRIRTDRTAIETRIDSLTKNINANDSRISKQIQIFRYETYKNIRDYRDSNNIQLLERLRSNDWNGCYRERYRVRNESKVCGISRGAVRFAQVIETVVLWL